MLEEYLQQLNWILKQLNQYKENNLSPEFQRNLRLIQKDVDRHFQVHRIVPKYSQSPVKEKTPQSDQKIYTEKEEMGLSDTLMPVDKCEGTEAQQAEHKETQTRQALPSSEQEQNQNNFIVTNETQEGSCYPQAQEGAPVVEVKETQTTVVDTHNTSSQAVEEEKDTASKETQADCQAKISSTEVKLTQTPTVEVQHNSVQPDEPFTDIKETQTRNVETLNTSSQATDESTNKQCCEHDKMDSTEVSMQTVSVDVQAMSSQTEKMATQMKEAQTELVLPPSGSEQQHVIVGEEKADLSVKTCAEIPQSTDELERPSMDTAAGEDNGQKEGDALDAVAETKTASKPDDAIAETTTASKPDENKNRRKKNRSKRSKFN